jgi:type IV pilus assembly protein PilB
MHISEQKLKEILIGSDVISEDVLTTAISEAGQMGQSVLDVLIGRGDLTENFLVELLEPYFGVPVIDLKQVVIPSEVLRLLPEPLAKSKGVILFNYDSQKGVAQIAMLDPLDLDTVEYVRAKLNAWVEVFLATSSNIKLGLKQYKSEIGLSFNQVINENVKQFMPASADAGKDADITKLAEAIPVITILNSIIDHAVALNASDIHFEPFQKTVVVRYRVDGIMEEILTLHKAIEPVLTARVKILSNMRVDEHRAPQDGRFRFEMEEGSTIDVRVNVIPVMHGEKVEMRLLKSSARPLSLDDLGISPSNVAILKGEIEKPHGMILITGPTGHGKTTTLYAIVHILNTPKVNITTIEDPVEYEMPRINQTQVNAKAGITFANGLRALLRQNPDVIMIGEIRDGETLTIAVQAALTGHLVLSSLHTNDAPSAVPRLLDMGAQAFLLSSTLNVVVAQRLVRHICASCIYSYNITSAQKQLINDQVAISGITLESLPETLYMGKGCNLCGHSGFIGQTGIFEILKVSESIKQSILTKGSAGSLRQQAIREGMKTMFEDGLEKVEQGVTTLEEILRVIRE